MPVHPYQLIAIRGQLVELALIVVRRESVTSGKTFPPAILPKAGVLGAACRHTAYAEQFITLLVQIVELLLIGTGTESGFNCGQSASQILNPDRCISSSR